jgi:hypothetical protein
MAGMICTIAEPERVRIKKLTFTWTSDDALGTAGGTTLNVAEGKILAAMAIPGTHGDPPTDHYDIALNDSSAHDVLLGQGANLNGGTETATNYLLEANLGAAANSRLTLAVTNAGNAKAGTFVCWFG